MNWKDTPDQYGVVSRFNHWFAALIIIAMIILGLYFTSLPKGDARSYWAGWHVSVGGLFFIYLLFRVFWRLIIKSPPPLKQPKSLQWASKLVHGILLLCIAIMAISGPLLIFSKGYDINVFGWFSIPTPISAEMHNAHDLHELAEEVHVFTATVLWVTLIIHILAAFKHLLTDKEVALKRMFKNTPS